jgi:hypothetical protein
MRVGRILQAIIAGVVLVVFGVINFQKGVIWFILLLLGAASISVGVRLFLDGRKVNADRTPPPPTR